MMLGPRQTAHERLNAWARRRRRDQDEDAFEAMPAAMRDRLRQEVARNLEGRQGMPELLPARAAEGWWQRCRALAARIGAGLGALVAVVALVRSQPDDPGGSEVDLRPNDAGVQSAEGPRGIVVAASTDVGADGPESRTPEPSPARSDAALVRAPAPRVVIPVGRLDLSAARELKNPLEGVIRLRRRYVASSESNAPAEPGPMLRRFEVARAPGRVEFRDEDGSVYAGRVEVLPGTLNGREDEWVFEGRGTHALAGGEVLLTGRFGPALETPDPRADRFMDAPFAGTAVMGDGRVVEIRAVPEP